MKNWDIIQGLLILNQYYDENNKYTISAEHDVLYAGATDTPLPEGTILKMIELDWHQEHDDRDYGEDFMLDDYRPDEPWVVYV